jgi:FMN reductase
MSDSSLSTPTSIASTLLLGNPRAGSRTAGLAASIARRIDSTAPTVIDLATFGAAVLDAEADLTRGARDALAASDLIVVATPAYKGGYTGVLKAFADTVPAASWSGVAVPVVVAGNPVHAALVDLSLRLLLTELGARLPVASVVALESQLGDPAAIVDTWATANLADLHAVLHFGRTAVTE